jgi:hypothetical protein
MMSAGIASAINQLASGPIAEPTPEALQAYIIELESDIRNADFRLQYLYRQRQASTELLVSAKMQAEKYQK